MTGGTAGHIKGLRREDLDLSATLRSGQVFRWTQDADHIWHGVIENQRRVRLQQSDDVSVWWEADGPDAEASVRSFLRIGPGEPDLAALAETWCGTDTLFAEAWARNPGIRVLRQDPDECFFAFLCASVAPIARISGMLRAVAGELGTVLDGAPHYTLFPTASQIAAASEDRLREMGLGFRARRVMEAARVLTELPPNHLAVLRCGATHDEAKKELTAFFGVGEKIADCVCLFALDKDGAIPVDTHIWRIAVTRYAPELAGKSLTSANYARVTQAFHDRFGPLAGWAQQTLFFRAAVGRQRP